MSLEMVLEMMLGCPRVPVPHGFFLVAKRLEGEELCVMEPTGGFFRERVYHVVCLLLVKGTDGGRFGMALVGVTGQVD